ncbi:MAG: PAS domain S-box protein [Deltaproteobacteria bacterium]|nr:PAS domain S-box protein [Deltaproteobacteria bacterium]
MGNDRRTKEQLREELVELRSEIKELHARAAKYQQIEQDLKESEKFYKTLFENSGTATILIEEDTTIAMLNNDFGIFTGYTPEEITGQTWTRFVAEDDVERLLDYHRKRRGHPDSAPRNYEFKIRNKKGEHLDIFMTIAMIPGTSLSIASMVDISERIKAERALRDSEERFRLLVETMNEGLGIQNRRGIITYVNDKICKILDLPRDEIVGKPSRAFISEQDLELWMQNMRNANAPESYEVTWRGKDGTPIYTIVSPRAMFDSQGRFIGGFGVITDITERRQLEKEILDTSERERQKIGYELHDDLGQHLIGIDVMTTVLKNTLQAKSPEDARYAGEINGLVKEAIKKTRQLARGLCPVHLASHGLEASLEELSGSTAGIFNITCTFNCPRHVPIRDNTLATHLYYITKESIHNAIEHGKATRILIDLLNTNNEGSLSILDNGIGIPEGLKPSGMGIRIMHYRARMIGASLKVESDPGGGTLVTCTFSLGKEGGNGHG